MVHHSWTVQAKYWCPMTDQGKVITRFPLHLLTKQSINAISTRFYSRQMFSVPGLTTSASWFNLGEGLATCRAEAVFSPSDMLSFWVLVLETTALPIDLLSLYAMFSQSMSQGNLILCLFLNNYAYICTWIIRNLKETVLKIIITWLTLGKQKIKANEIYWGNKRVNKILPKINRPRS